MKTHHFHIMYIGMDRCRLSVSFPGYEDEESVVVVQRARVSDHAAHTYIQNEVGWYTVSLFTSTFDGDYVDSM